MTPTIIPGGTYGEALPSGAYGVLVPGQHVATHLGPIPLPAQEVATGGKGPLYLRVSEVGGWQMAGQSHSLTGVSWHYVHGQWLQVENGAHGVSGLIFDNVGALRFANPATGSQGFRYVARDNSLVTGDATYHDAARRIWEYTTHGDLTIGQGAANCILLRGAQRKVLSFGEARFVRFNRAGDVCAVTVVQLASRRTLLFWFTVAEIDALPDEPTHGPVPPPVELPPVPELPNRLKYVKDARTHYAQMPPGYQRGFCITNMAAWLDKDNGAGTFAKGGGDGFDPPGDNENAIQSADTLMYRHRDGDPEGKGATFDVLVNAEGAATPSWSRTDPSGYGDVARWRAPIDPALLDKLLNYNQDETQPPPPVVEPPPTQSGYDDTAIQARIDTVERTVDALRMALSHEIDLRVALEARVSSLRVTGQTGRTFGHGHSVSLKVEG